MAVPAEDTAEPVKNHPMPDPVTDAELASLKKISKTAFEVVGAAGQAMKKLFVQSRTSILRIRK